MLIKISYNGKSSKEIFGLDIKFQEFIKILSNMFSIDSDSLQIFHSYPQIQLFAKPEDLLSETCIKEGILINLRFKNLNT